MSAPSSVKTGVTQDGTAAHHAGRAVRGEDMFVHPRFHETIPVAVGPILEKALANETAFEASLENWLAQRKRR